jgi:MFS family permease
MTTIAPEPSPDPESVSLLHHRPFMLYWVGRICSSIGFQMVGVAVGYQLYLLTGDPFDLGLVGLVQFLPSVLLILLAGQMADRYDRKLILQVAQALEGAAALALAIGSFSGLISKGFILAALFVLGVGRAFEGTANQAFLPAIVTATQFPRAIAASSAAQQAATIGGPAIAGFMYLVSPTFVYGFCALLFACASAQLLFVKVIRVVVARQPLTLQTFFAGLSYIRNNRIVLALITLDLFAVLLGGATVLLPVYAKDILHVGPEGLGLLRAAPAVGALFTMLLLVRWPLVRHVGRIEYVTVASFGVATIVFGLSTWFWLSMVALVMLGASDAISVVIRQTLVQVETPDEMRGRVAAVNSLFVSTSNQLGDFRAGSMAAWIGTIPAVLVGGIGTLLTVALCLKLFPDLKAVQSLYPRKKTEG